MDARIIRFLAIVQRIESLGFVEGIPFYDYDTGDILSRWQKGRFEISHNRYGWHSCRLDKEYIYGYRLGEYRIAR
jgi:hypothetical protein